MTFKRILMAVTMGIILVAQSVGFTIVQAASNEPPTQYPIKHIVVILQENHTFDNYFGTYPGADGIPAGTKMPVNPNDPGAGYVAPFHIGNYPISDLSHSADTYKGQYNDGAMNGFVYALDQKQQDGKLSMGYYTDQELPYYWNLADNYTLFDRFFSSATDGSFANHMFWVAATPPTETDPRRSTRNQQNVQTIFDELQAKGISWKFYVQNYDPTITYRTLQNAGNRASQVVWVPLLNFDRFIDDPALSSHIVDLNQYYIDLHDGNLPAVAYIAPSGGSEHPPGSVQTGQRFVKSLIQELMRSSAWDSSAFLLAYDDWGGWYDHVVPPQVDTDGYGLRVPAILVSPYSRQGYIDHGEYDFTSILKFIEENWGVDALTERDANANSLSYAFNFRQKPRPPIFVSSVRTSKQTPKGPPVRIIYSGYIVALSFAGLTILAAILSSFVFNRRNKLRLPRVVKEGSSH